MDRPEQEGRAPGRRVRTKRARRDGKRDVIPVPKSTNSVTPHWKVVSRRFVDGDSVREYHVLKTLRQIRSKLIDHPHVSEPKSAGKAFCIKSPRVRFVPLLLRAKTGAMDLDSLLEMQQALLDYVGLLYSKGVAYHVKPEYMCPVKKASGRWKLYLGGWMEAGFDPTESQLRPTEWERQKTTQCDEIKRIFADAQLQLPDDLIDLEDSQA
ncbi:hypothetical protein FE257_005951 [Aspergillus nanangensis]|uniref:Uncharacterized protein n=1 Tax=Aspergillus nanangensis TaxID=2582783 RepID=A0AAD4GMT0_ASPNN|nr:hypothetical protein FE257_005951 [Aspergillus nanangensis]